MLPPGWEERKDSIGRIFLWITTRNPHLGNDHRQMSKNLMIIIHHLQMEGDDLIDEPVQHEIKGLDVNTSVS